MFLIAKRAEKDDFSQKSDEDGLSRLSHIIKYTEALGWQLSEGQDFVPIDVLNTTVITTKVLFLHFNYRSQGNFTKPASKKHFWY